MMMNRLQRIARPTAAFAGVLIVLLLPFTIINGVFTLIGDSPTYAAFLFDIIMLGVLVAAEPAASIAILGWFGVPTGAARLADLLLSLSRSPQRIVTIAAAAAELHRRQGDDHRAGIMADRAIDAWPKVGANDHVRRAYQVACDVKGHLLLASADYRKALDAFYAPLTAGLDSNSARADQCLDCVAVMIEMGHFIRASEFLEHVKALGPLSESAAVSVETFEALILADRGDLDHACRKIDSAVSAATQPAARAGAAALAAWLKITNGDARGAVAAMSTAQKDIGALSETPWRARAVQARILVAEARILIAGGAVTDAVATLHRATQLGGVVPAAMYDLWIIYESMEEHAKANSWRSDMQIVAPESYLTRRLNEPAAINEASTASDPPVPSAAGKQN